jgi:hypothetical protein
MSFAGRRLKLIRQLSQKPKTKNSRIVSVREMEIESISSNDRGMPQRNVFRDLCVVERLFAGPFVDAPGAGAATPELIGSVVGLDVVGPCDSDRGIILFDDLNRFQH